MSLVQLYQYPFLCTLYFIFYMRRDNKEDELWVAGYLGGLHTG